MQCFSVWYISAALRASYTSGGLLVEIVAFLAVIVAMITTEPIHQAAAAARVEFYLQVYVRNSTGLTPSPQPEMSPSEGPPGSMDLMHWKDNCEPLVG